MNAPGSRAGAGPSLLGGFLAAGGLVATAVAVLGDRLQLADHIEHQLQRAQGTISPATSAWLHGPALAHGFGFAAVLLFALGALCWLLRPALERQALRWLPSNATTADRPWLLPLVAGVAVMAYYFPTLAAGYFRYDDFELISVAREQPLGAALLLPHGDHFLPLTRVLFHVAYHCFGVTPLPYNLWLLACLAGVLVAGLRLLAELGVSPPAQLLFLVLVVFWSPAAEIMSGYYVLSTYLVIALLSLLAAWCYLRWRRTGRAIFGAGLIAAVFLAPLVDISGWYVAGVAGVFLLAGIPRDGFGPWWRQHGRLVLGLALAAGVGLALTVYAYHVRNPGSFLAMAGAAPRTPLRLAAEFVYLFTAGLLLPLAVPFVYARLPGMLLAALAGLAFVCWLAGFISAWRRAEPDRRRTLVALLVVVAGICLMLNLGRPNADSLMVRWAAKHVVPAHLWLCLLLCAGWDALWRKLREAFVLRFAEGTVIAVVLFVTAQTALGLLGLAIAFPPFGYPAELRDALRRREAVATLREEVIAPLARHADASAPVPTLDGVYLAARWPSLFEYNLSHYEAFFGPDAGKIPWVRNPAMQAWHAPTVRTVPDLRVAVSPRVVELLSGNTALREMYFSPARLTPLATKDQAPPATVTTEVIASDDKREVVIHAGAWSPGTAPHLKLAVQTIDAGAAREIPVEVKFHSECLGADWQGVLVLPADGDTVTAVDLRQAYAFSLSPRVSGLRLRFMQPGRYVIRLAEVVP